MLGLFCLACNAAVEPEPVPTSTFSFTPDLTQINIAAGHFEDFQVSHGPDPVFAVDWQLNGASIALGPRFRYIPATTKLDTLTALATWQDHAVSRTWLIDSMHDQPTAVGFSPTESLMDIVVGDTCRFRIISSRATQTTYLWELGGQTVGQAESFLLADITAGHDTLRATAFTPDHTAQHIWDLHVFAQGELPPLPPREFFVQAGALPATVETFWRAAEPRGDPVVSYEIALSYDGAVTDANWDQAMFVAEINSVPGQEIYQAAIADTLTSLRPGAHAWLGIRSRNQAGIQSLNTPHGEVDISEPWWASGVVIDDTGAPLAGVTVRTSADTFSGQTEADGSYRIGPFRSTDTITLRTESPDIMPEGEITGAWSDALSPPLFFQQVERWDFVLITLYNLESTCETYNGSFPAFLRGLTHTQRETDLRPNLNLYKWDSYPVTVWVPNYHSPEAYDYGTLCREAVQMWNIAMDDQYLTLVTDPDEARIVLRFGDDGDATLGEASLLEPADRSYLLGDVIPEKVEVYVRDRLNSAQFIQEVAMHELGHALGLSRHVVCSDGSYLMATSPSGRLNDGPQNVLNQDERHALMVLRTLPQGFDMSLYR